MIVFNTNVCEKLCNELRKMYFMNYVFIEIAAPTKKFSLNNCKNLFYKLCSNNFLKKVVTLMIFWHRNFNKQFCVK